jgi:hypothetical protein
VTDDVGVTSATLHWTDPGGKSGSTSMALRSGQWHAPLGPFGSGTVTWHVTAADAAGNTGTGSTNKLTVNICIG